MISLIRRHTAAWRSWLLQSVLRHRSDRQDASKAARPRKRPPPPRRTGGRAGTGSRADRDEGNHRKPYGSSAVASGGLRLQGHADHPGDHVDGQLVHHLREALGAVQADAPGARDAGAFWKSSSLRDGAKKLKMAARSLHRGDRAGCNEHHEGALTETSTSTLGSRCRCSARSTRCRPLQDGLAFLARWAPQRRSSVFSVPCGHLSRADAIGSLASVDRQGRWPRREALIMTAIGLAVAVPAVMGYNWLVRRNKVAMDLVRTFGATCMPSCSRKIELRRRPRAERRAPRRPPWQ